MGGLAVVLVGGEGAWAGSRSWGRPACMACADPHSHSSIPPCLPACLPPYLLLPLFCRYESYVTYPLANKLISESAAKTVT